MSKLGQEELFPILYNWRSIPQVKGAVVTSSFPPCRWPVTKHRDRRAISVRGQEREKSIQPGPLWGTWRGEPLADTIECYVWYQVVMVTPPMLPFHFSEVHRKPHHSMKLSVTRAFSSKWPGHHGSRLWATGNRGESAERVCASKTLLSPALQAKELLNLRLSHGR